MIGGLTGVLLFGQHLSGCWGFVGRIVVGFRHPTTDLNPGWGRKN